MIQHGNYHTVYSLTHLTVFDVCFFLLLLFPRNIQFKASPVNSVFDLYVASISETRKIECIIPVRIQFIAPIREFSRETFTSTEAFLHCFRSPYWDVCIYLLHTDLFKKK